MNSTLTRKRQDPQFGFRESIVPCTCLAVRRKLAVRPVKKDPAKSIAIPTDSQTRNALSRSVIEIPSAHPMPAEGPVQTSRTSSTEVGEIGDPNSRMAI